MNSKIEGSLTDRSISLDLYFDLIYFMTHNHANDLIENLYNNGPTEFCVAPGLRTAYNTATMPHE